MSNEILVSKLNNPDSLDNSESFDIKIAQNIISSLTVLLRHPVFEIRRVVLQNLPSLARVLAIHMDILSIFTEFHEYYSTAIDDKKQDEEEFICYSIWLAEVVKAFQHIYEVIHCRETTRLDTWALNISGFFSFLLIPHIK